MKKSLILILCIFLFNTAPSFGADFIVPNSSGEPIVIDVSNLNLTSGTNVSIGEFTDQPRTYRDTNTKSIVVFPPPISNSEKTIQVLAGGSSVTKTINFRPSPPGSLKNSLLPDLEESRAGNSATKISDGRVVLIGGSKGLAEEPINSIEVFNPESGKSESLKTSNGLKQTRLKIPRSQHSATYLGISELPIGMITGPVEQILVVGGFSGGGFLESSIEIVEIKVGTLQSTSTLLDSKKTKLKKARIFHTANLLPDGRVLIAGGQGKISMTNLGALNNIEIFDPTTKAVLPSGLILNTPRILHTATTLQNGDILITGGFTNEKQDEFGSGPATNTVELIDSKNLSIKKVGLLKEAVGGHSATLLTNGLVLIIGGSSDFFSSRTKDAFRGLPKTTIQFYENASQTFNLVASKSGGNLELQTPRFLCNAVLLPNGNLVVVGGLNIKASSTNTSTLISTPVSTTEVFDLDLVSASSGSLKGEKKLNLETNIGRILPTVVVVTPKNKTQGFLSDVDLGKFVNIGIYVTGGFTNGLGKLPTKVSEFFQIELNTGIEGRQIKLTPGAIIEGSYLKELLVKLDKFSKIPSLKVEPQTINLSSSNDFMTSIKVLSTDNQVVLLKAENSDSIIVSPSLFQIGENVTISRKDSSVQGEFEISILPSDQTQNSTSFIPAKVKVNVSNSSKPFLSTVPPFGISLSNQSGDNSEKIQLKVFSQDGKAELTTILPGTMVTASIVNPDIANLGGTGISSVVGTLATQFVLNVIKPGSTSLNFSIDSSDVLGVSIPLVVSGTPTFQNNPIDTTVLANLALNGLESSRTVKIDSTTVSLEDVRLSSGNILFPIYVPINLQNSVDGTNEIGTFTIRPIFGIDLFTAVPRTVVNKTGSNFKPSLVLPLSIAGIVPTSSVAKPFAILASLDGIRTISYDESTDKNIDETFNMISKLDNVLGLKLFEFANKPKIVALKETMIFLLDAGSGDEEASSNLSGSGLELNLTNINNQNAAVVSLGSKGVDLIFPITDSEPRVVNFKLPGDTKHISVIDKLADVVGPFVVAYDGLGALSIVNLRDINVPIEIINTEGEKITKIDYAGRFTVNGQVADVLIATSGRKVLLYDLNNKISIPVNEELKIKNQIEDLLVIDGIAYLALGPSGIIALSIGSLLNNNEESEAVVAQFKKNKLTVVRANGKQETISKPLGATKLANSKPFLLSSGPNNDLTVIRVSP